MEPGHSRPGTEVLDHLKTDRLTLLGMKLAGDDVVLPHSGCEWRSILGHGRNYRGIGRFNIIGVHEITITACRDPGERGADRMI